MGLLLQHLSVDEFCIDNFCTSLHAGARTVLIFELILYVCYVVFRPQTDRLSVVLRFQIDRGSIFRPVCTLFTSNFCRSGRQMTLVRH